MRYDFCSSNSTHDAKLFPGVLNIEKDSRKFIHLGSTYNSAATSSLLGDLLFVWEFIDFVTYLNIF